MSYYKGAERHPASSAATKPIATVASADFGSPGPVIDFTPPLSHTLLRDNIHKKGRFEKMTLAGRPPVGLGVTSGGNFYGNTEITFTDVLGDKPGQLLRAVGVAVPHDGVHVYLNIEHRLQYALQGFSSDTFYLRAEPVSLRSVARAVHRSRPGRSPAEPEGGTAFAI